MIYKFNLTLLLIAFISIPISAQNLVPNPSFENITAPYCGLIGNSNTFNTTIIDWFVPTATTPDIYFTTVDPSCFNYQPFSEYTGPIGIKGNQIPNTGAAMVGLVHFTIPTFNQRDYITIQLSEPMVSGHNYEVSYFTSLADFVEYSVGEVGVHFSLTMPSGTSTDPLNVIPQLTTTTDLGNFEDWVFVTDIFTADDNYEFMTIGNFKSDDNTTLTPNPNASGGVGTYGSYYFFDDFSVVDLDVTAVKNIQLTDFTIFPNPVDDVLQLEFSKPLENAIVSISDLSGHIISTQQLQSDYILQIDTHNFPTGIYSIMVESGMSVYVERFIKF